MPVSSPSYFPPNRANGTIIGISAGPTTGARDFLAGLTAGANTALSDLIIIGHQAGSAGLGSSGPQPADMTGAIIIGNTACQDLIGTSSTANVQPVTVIGYQALLNATFADSTVAIGDQALAEMVGTNANHINRCVIIGSQVCRRMSTNLGSNFNQSVVIGYNAGSCAVGSSDINKATCVIIGSNACGNGNAAANRQLTGCVIVGRGAGAVLGGSNNVLNNTFIGDSVGSIATEGDNNSIVGAGSFNSTNASDNSYLGAGIVSSSGIPGSRNIAIGSGVNVRTGTNNIFIGYQCNAPATAYTDKLLIEETSSAAGRRALIFADFATNNIIIGQSTEGTNRAFGSGATNILKWINGTIGDATTPVGGAYLFSTAGNLRHVNANNISLAVQGGQSFTVATLPNAANAGIGARTIVTDATLTTITGLGLAPTGGGANTVPVYSDGTNWIML